MGGGIRHYELGRFLSEKGNTVSIVASSYGHSTHRYCTPEDVSIRQFNDGFRFIRLRTKPAYASYSGRLINYYHYMMKASRLDCFGCEPDVIIASSVHPLAWVAGYRLSRRYNSKFVIEVRDLWPLGMYEDFEGLQRAIVFAYFESLERKYYRLAQAIVSTAPFAHEYMEEKFGISRDKVHYIPHGLDLDEFDRNANLDERTLNGELRTALNSNFCVTYAGSLSKSEGLPAFVRAAKYLEDLSDIRLVIVGSGTEGEQLAMMIREENLRNVTMIASQPRISIPLTLRKSKILFCGLAARRVYEYGISKNKFYDYMAARKPIVFASDVRSSLIDMASAGITVAPDDAEQIAGAIRHIYSNMGTIGSTYAENGRAYVEKHHSIEGIADQFLNVIESC